MALKNNFLLALTCLLWWPAFAQQPDTLTGGRFREVQVTARRIDQFAAGKRHTTIDSAFLKRSHGASLSEVLELRLPVYFKSYGSGMIATPSFRGTSANHTAVLWNGFNLAQPTLGLSDFSLFPVGAVNSVQVQHGAAGSNYGTGAIGGAILLTSPDQLKPGLGLGAQQDLGSFGRSYSQLHARYGTSQVGGDLTIMRLQVQNNFPFRNITRKDAPVEEQRNAAVNQLGFTQNLIFRLKPSGTLFLRSWYATSNTEAQPTMLAANNLARNLNRNLRLASEWENASKAGKTNIRAAYFHDYMRYQDQVSGISASRVQTYQLQGEHSVSLKNGLTLKAGAEAQLFDAAVAEYQKAASEKRASVFALLSYELASRFHLNLNYRQAFIEGYDPPAAPMAGFSFALRNTSTSKLSWKANVSRGYRVPTLNDRFWPPGNPDLKPETSWNYETGLAYALKQNNLTLETELTGYALQVDNWIQWVPGAGGTNLWAPRNLKKVTSRGLEYTARMQYQLAQWVLTGGGAVAYTQAKQTKSALSSEPAGKLLIYVPPTTGNLYAEASFKNWFLNLNWQYTGYRFTTSANDRWLPAYGLASLYAGKTFTTGRHQVQVMGQVKNAFNAAYQNLEYYAMPGRHYNLSLRYNFN